MKPEYQQVHTAAQDAQCSAGWLTAPGLMQEDDFTEAEAEFIAACSPAVVLALLKDHELMLSTLKEIERLGHDNHHGRGYSLATIAQNTIKQIEETKRD